MHTDELLITAFDRAEDEYAPILEFARQHNNIGYAKFDSYTTSKVNLFALRENYDFDALEETLDKILTTLPAIKRIFARPIMRLKDSNEILPVESVKVINNRTIIHTALHSELWSNVTSGGVTPKKLLTVKSEDDYAIYENIGFAYVIGAILQLVNRNIRILHDILFDSQDLNFNLLERENHLSYFLAIGKLHTGYVRYHNKYRTSAERCMDKLLFIDRVLSARLGSPVYKQCKRYTDRFVLKKTTVFRVHKDYHRIYLLLKWFSDLKAADTSFDMGTTKSLSESYGVYCTLLSLFAAGHFNFNFEDKETFDFFSLNTQCTFEQWNLKIESVSFKSIGGILFTFSKDRVYRAIVITSSVALEGQKNVQELMRAKFSVDECLFADLIKSGGNYIILSLFDIESFRRIQQILLRGMIYSDTSRQICPFCGQHLRNTNDDENNTIYECDSCRTHIVELICPKTGVPYFATKIKNFTPPEKDFSFTNKKEELLYRKFVERQMYFRNITDISENADIICPECRTVHTTT